jgi:hypothetical protein
MNFLKSKLDASPPIGPLLKNFQPAHFVVDIEAADNHISASFFKIWI